MVDTTRSSDIVRPYDFVDARRDWLVLRHLFEIKEKSCEYTHPKDRVRLMQLRSKNRIKGIINLSGTRTKKILNDMIDRQLISENKYPEEGKLQFYYYDILQCGEEYFKELNMIVIDFNKLIDSYKKGEK